MGVGSGGQGGHGPWIFKHGTNIVNRGLKVLFFGLFCYFSDFLPTLLVQGTIKTAINNQHLFFEISCTKLF